MDYVSYLVGVEGMVLALEVHDETPDGGRQLFAPGLLRRGGTLHAVSSKPLDLAAQGALGRSLALAAHPVVLADCESIVPALGWGFLPNRTRKRSRSAVFSCSHTPSMCQILK